MLEAKWVLYSQNAFYFQNILLNSIFQKLSRKAIPIQQSMVVNCIFLRGNDWDFFIESIKPTDQIDRFKRRHGGRLNAITYYGFYV